MAKQTGQIGVTSENIFPIIKKFLYSDHEIFLRELISNAVDATQKLKTLATAGDFKGELGDCTIEVTVDKKAGTLTISDRGIGMTQEEVERYINQIALSGAEAFLSKYKDQANNIIGHFGLGFYSAFMVSERVEIESLSWQPEAKPVHWACEGDPSYTLEEGKRKDRGTDIILHIAKENEEFLEQARVEELLEKYCRFLPVPIACGKKREWKNGKEVLTDEANIINTHDPLWAKRPADLKPEDYEEFYSYLFPGAEPPLFYIHLNVDYPFTLTGILYFPRIRNQFDMQRNKIQLYCNQVFVTDAVEGIVPEFLTVLHGVIDSPDIPLNVSRSYLQSDSNVKKISAHITKKVADRLQELFDTDREAYQKKWDDLKLFVAYGMITDEKFYEKAEKFALFKNVDGKYFTLEEYKNLVGEAQKDKHGSTIYLYSTDRDGQWSYIEQAKNRGYDVLLMDGQLDSHLINHLESKLEKVRFTRVDSATVDHLIEKENQEAVTLTANEQDYLRTAVEAAADGQKQSIFVSIEALGEQELPAVITQNEFMRRMKDMAALSPTGNFYASMPGSLTLVLNASHPLIKELAADVVTAKGAEVEAVDKQIAPLRTEEETLRKKTDKLKPEEVEQADKDRLSALSKSIDDLQAQRKEILDGYGKASQMAHQVVDLALLANNLLKGEELARFVRRSVEMIEK